MSVVRGIGFAIVVVTVGAIAATAMPAQRRGEGLGVLGVVAMLPAVVALPFGLWLAGAVGYAAVFAIGGGAALLACRLSSSCRKVEARTSRTAACRRACAVRSCAAHS